MFSSQFSHIQRQKLGFIKAFGFKKGNWELRTVDVRPWFDLHLVQNEMITILIPLLPIPILIPGLPNIMIPKTYYNDSDCRAYQVTFFPIPVPVACDSDSDSD